MPDEEDDLQEEEDDLEMFRNQWRRELDTKTDTAGEKSQAEDHHEEDDIHKRVRDR